MPCKRNGRRVCRRTTVSKSTIKKFEAADKHYYELWKRKLKELDSKDRELYLRIKKIVSQMRLQERKLLKSDDVTEMKQYMKKYNELKANAERLHTSREKYRKAQYDIGLNKLGKTVIVYRPLKKFNPSDYD